MRSLTLAEGVRIAAAKRPDRVAITIDDERLTYVQLVNPIAA